MADKVKEFNQYNLLKSKYLGLGNPDSDRRDFLSTMHRDTYASLAQHDSLLLYNSVALNENPELLRQKLIKKIVNPIKVSSQE
ncbi:uncharacterized protein PRCAT00005748001 [Priceomyces carsonii]|uniref:uncharacterized protein n=1 Tax=Priceomyces carsonii TaxID=28549 RepID=UPI002EDAC3B0|nr:unnamed protein product [Priceomyces carsonii]